MHSEEGNEEALKRVEAMLAEAGRVLRDNGAALCSLRNFIYSLGTYICITLAQSHVLRTLLGAFFKPEFAVEYVSFYPYSCLLT